MNHSNSKYKKRTIAIKRAEGRQLPSLWLARTSTNLLPCTANLILFLQEYMMQNHPNKLESLWTTQWLSIQVSHIFISIHVKQSAIHLSLHLLKQSDTQGHTASSSMSMPLLLRCIGHSCCLQTHSSAHRNLDTHPHPQLVTQASDILCRATHKS